MSANLLAEGDRRTGSGGTTYADGVWSIPANGTSKDKNAVNDWPTGTEAVSGNQTLHVGLSVRAASGASVLVAPGVAYVDGAGNVNYAFTRVSARGTGAWQRVEGSFVMPSGMRVSFFFVHQGAGGAALELTAPCLSYGSAVCLASSAHTPYATQDHVSVTYATKASLKVTDDSVKAEVSARAQTDRNVADLSSRLTQTANSLTTEISDRRSAIATVTGLANTAQSTADSAAKQTTIYSFNNGDAGPVAKWIHLGTLTSAGDSSSATVTVFSGDGYNGSASQNSKLTITIKDGSQSAQSATGACGVTAMRENCDDALVDVLAQSATVYDVWVYAPWKYSRGCYSVSGQYASWQHSGATQKAEPATSATQVKQDVAYRLADATKAQTMATENQSSIKQLSTSITAEVTARTKTDQMVSDLSSRLTQTANSLTTEISDRRSAITTVTGLANAAQSTADAAKSSASNAVSTANSASSSAANAVETANAASSAASAASTAAGKASTDAAAAVKTANSASSTASGAVTTANEAAATANAASDTATAAQTMATENRSSIKQLSNSITSEVTQRAKTDQMVSDLSSKLTQTADGFNASIDRLSDTDKKVNSWFGFGSDASGNPQLTMGSSSSPVVGVYTNAGLAYKARSGATLLELDGASRSSTMPHVHADDVSMGSWQWVPTQNGTHFTLRYIGG